MFRVTCRFPCGGPAPARTIVELGRRRRCLDAQSALRQARRDPCTRVATAFRRFGLLSGGSPAARRAARGDAPLFRGFPRAEAIDPVGGVASRGPHEGGPTYLPVLYVSPAYSGRGCRLQAARDRASADITTRWT